MDWIDDIGSRLLCRDSEGLGETPYEVAKPGTLRCRYCGEVFETTSNTLPVHDDPNLNRIEPADVRRLIKQVRWLADKYVNSLQR